MGKLGLAAPVYATLPVAKLGHLYMYDHMLSRQAVSDFDTFDLDDVDFAFNSVETIKYAENRVLSGKELRPLLLLCCVRAISGWSAVVFPKWLVKGDSAGRLVTLTWPA